MADFRYNCNNNAIRNQKNVKLTAYGDTPDSGMIVVTDKSLPY